MTGGRGFIGTHTTNALRDQGADVLAASRPTLDCTDPASLAAIGREHPITTIVHLAAAPLATAEPLTALAQNTTAVSLVLRAAAGWHTERIVLASTIGVYAGVEEYPWREDAPLPLASPHPIPASKKIAEILALASGLNVVVARIGAIWGPGARETSPFIAAPALIRGTSAPVHAGDGADLLYAPDCGAALAFLATAPALRHRVYNVSTGRPTTNAEFAAALDGPRPPLIPGSSGPIPYLDTTRLRSEGWQPRWTLPRAVADYRSWLAAGNVR
ncbi:NAD-dependent epimerase/dehydratase family protein [Dactylosporangium sp. NPDC051541]|uniref:NAD-dependent epimerase/dehydratase family protein n=1 Tax=Dactylosporangium sp. NPDC051541 TaxID=3363977 RepID=UPI0037AC9009